MLLEELICKVPLGFITVRHWHHWNGGNLKWVGDMREGEQRSTYWILGTMASYECLKMNCNRCCNCKAMEDDSYRNLDLLRLAQENFFLKETALEGKRFSKRSSSSPFFKSKALTLRDVEVNWPREDCHCHASHCASDSCCLHKKEWPHGSGSSSGITMAHTWFLYLYYKAQKHSTQGWLPQLVESSLHGSNDLHWQGGAGHWEHCPLCLFDLITAVSHNSEVW